MLVRRCGLSAIYLHCPRNIGAGSMKRYGIRLSVRLCVPASARNSKPAAADLLLWARQAGDRSNCCSSGGRMVRAVPLRQRTYVAEHTQTHKHTHPFNGPSSGTTRMSRYQKGKTNLDFTEARDSEWQWHQLGHMQVRTSLQSDNHASTPPLVLS